MAVLDVNPDRHGRELGNANVQHVETGYGYIRWTLPKDPPQDVDLGPARELAAKSTLGIVIVISPAWAH